MPDEGTAADIRSSFFQYLPGTYIEWIAATTTTTACCDDADDDDDVDSVVCRHSSPIEFGYDDHDIHDDHDVRDDTTMTRPRG